VNSRLFMLQYTLYKGIFKLIVTSLKAFPMS